MNLEINRKFRDKIAYYIVVLLVYLFISLVMFWQISGGMTSRVVNGTSDVYQSLWSLWWVPYSLFALHSSPYATHLLFYPVGANLVTQTLTPIAGILMAPFDYNLAVAYNTLFFSSFALAGLFMFFLADYIVKNRYAAFIAGLVYAFSPMHIAQSYSHLDWTIVEFIPLFILFFLMMIREEKRKPVYAIGAAISFLLLTFMGDIEQGILAVVFVLISLLLFTAYELRTRRYSVLTRSFYLAFAIMIVLILLLGSPFLIPIFKGITPAVLNETNAISGPAQNMLWSDNLASFFLPSYYNGIFHGLSLSYFNALYALKYQGIQYQHDATEKVSYLGYSVLLLVLLALYYDRKSGFSKTRFWLAVLIVFGWLSLGPLLQVYSTVTPIPALYAVYRHIPYFNILREPGRFDLVVTIALAILAAIGFSELSKKYKGKNVMAMAIAFSVLILIEYNGAPISASYVNQSYMPLHIPTGYKELANVSGNYTTLILPDLPNVTLLNVYPGLAMYWQTAFKKPIVGGYTSRENETQLLSVRSIPLSVSAGYLEAGEGFAYPSPILENYTNVTLFWLGYYNVGFVGVARQAYNASEQQSLLSYLYSVFGQAVYQDNNTTIFSTSTALNAHFGRPLVSYPAGTWLPGFAICSVPYCNVSVENAWWGSNYRGITIYSPNASNATIRFGALSYYAPTQISAYENSPAGFLTTINVTQLPENYSLAMKLQKGFNELFLISGNLSSSPSIDPYLTYGIYNMTVAR